MNSPNDKRIALLALGIIGLDQLTKFIVLKLLGFHEERVVLDGFFKFVHWGNTGAAWSMFHGRNGTLAIVSTLALGGLIWFRRHFEPQRLLGWIALGLLYGGIVGNLIDRLLPSRRHVIDFIRFYVNTRNGNEVGFPAFNVADSAICVGVGLMILLAWRAEERGRTEEPATERTPKA